ncbi:MAG: hypothetical protein HYT31_04330 [Parcubacteria group bacterium]|nr:hypothetical protein [Parcubacteria group bacterium]
MQAKVVHHAGMYRLALPDGTSVALDSSAIPKALAQGGDCQIVVVPAGESVPDAQGRELLNQLLHTA